MGVVTTDGLMEEPTMGSGNSIRCMAEECSHGTMEEDMKENTLMIKSKAKVYSSGLMEENTMVVG